MPWWAMVSLPIMVPLTLAVACVMVIVAVAVGFPLAVFRTVVEMVCGLWRWEPPRWVERLPPLW